MHPDLTPEYKILKMKYDLLKKDFTELFAQKDDMLTQEEPILTALYLTNIGQKQHQKFSLQVEIKMLKQRIDLYQSYFNRNQYPDTQSIEKKIDKLFSNYRKQLEEEAKRIAQAKNLLKDGFLSVEEVKKIKDVYRQIVKRLHPDINPDVTNAEKDLFIKAQAAYDLNDLITLNAILLSLDNAGAKVESTPPDLKTTVATLEDHVSKLKDQIEKLKNQFPFTFREKLADEVWVEAERKQLDNDIVALTKEKEKYSEYLILLKEWKPSALTS